jgi:hypothetical protein
VLKKIIVFISFCIFLQASSVEVIKASRDIRYKNPISKTDLYLDIVDINSIDKFCNPVARDDFSKSQFRAKKYIRKDKIICIRDIYKSSIVNDKVLFDFGLIQIERAGKIVRETKDYVRIRDENGNLQKVYKNGKLK